MINAHAKKWGFILFVFLMPMISIAAVPAWKIVPKESNLTFTATQNDAPVSGEFKTFTGNINLDLEQLNASNIEITVNVASLADPYNQLVDTLTGKDWFNTALFPRAIFKSSSISKIGNNTYEAQGTLTLRDKTSPIVLTFTQEEYSPNKVRFKGNTTIKRLAFGVGQGDWADTKTIRDDVKINFTITLVKK